MTGKRRPSTASAMSAPGSGSTVAGTGKPIARAVACWWPLSMVRTIVAHGLQGRRSTASTSASRGPMAATASSWVGNSTPPAPAPCPRAMRSSTKASPSVSGSAISTGVA